VFYPSLFAENSWWRVLIYLNAVSLVIRSVQRIYFTTILYGWAHGVLSVPRMVVSNFVNFMAVARAWRLYLSYLFRGKALVWDKTMHDFPAGEQLLRRRQRLGDLLQSWQAVDEGTLTKALREQTLTGMPLGRVMVSNGWLDEETLAEAIAYQADLLRARVTAELVSENAGRLSPEMSAHYRAVCVGADETGRPILAVASPLPPEWLTEIERVMRVAPRQRIARESEIAIALRSLASPLGRTAPGLAGQVPLLGDLLIQQGLLNRAAFESAMETYRPDQHGRVGDYLVESGVIQRDVIERMVGRQRLMHAEAWRAPDQEVA
jgi:bacteriophage N4 adsorption protein B